MNQPPPTVPTFTPSDEPYLGLKSLYWFDRIIVWALAGNSQVATYTHQYFTALNDLQKAACQIIPQGINIALSIRELIRQAYLFPALVLMRPLIERAAIISYLHSQPAAIELWQNGWKYRERPSLAKMLQTMGGQINQQYAQNICSVHNHIVHGDPISSYYNLINLSDGAIGYASGKILNHPDMCDEIAMEAQCYLVVLAQRMALIFPEVDVPPMADGPLNQA